MKRLVQKAPRDRLYVPAEVAQVLAATARAAGASEAEVIEAALRHWSRLDLPLKRGLVMDYLAHGTVGRRRKDARGWRDMGTAAAAGLGRLIGWSGRGKARAA